MNKIIKNYPQSTLQFVVIFSAFLIVVKLLEKYTVIEELHWLVILFFKFVLIVFLVTLLNFEKEVRIEKSNLIKGNYNKVFGFVRIEKQFKIDSITDIVLFQNPKEHFEIQIISTDDEMIINTFPNKNPAKEELERIKTIIKTVTESPTTQ